MPKEPTERQKRAAQNISENLRNKGEALRDAGYSEQTSKSPTIVTESKGFKEANKPFVERLKKERDRVLEAMTQKDLDIVTYNHLSEAVVRGTHDIQLQEGKPTEITNQEEEINEKIDRINTERERIKAERTGSRGAGTGVGEKKDSSKEPSKDIYPKREDSRIH